MDSGGVHIYPELNESIVITTQSDITIIDVKMLLE
jgi:hypothetical protein